MCTLTPNLERLDLTIGEKDLKDLEYLYILLMQRTWFLRICLN
jgi:hypothetical protein